MARNENTLLKKLKYRNYEMYKYFQKALEILSVLNEKAYEAYIVGGAIRDLYLNIDFNDIDIATNATPQAIKNLFSNCNVDMQYEHLGSVVLKIENFRYEITTFRSEEYVKHRLRAVHYSKKLVDDIKRRDFTINALAMTLNQNVIDIVKGEKDIQKRCIKVIGKGKNRFKDDPTRILRGIHLVSKLNFRIDRKTEYAMVKSRQYLSEISNFKIITHLKKILNEKYSDVAIKVMKRLNIFKEMPKYSEWIKIISKTKKLNYIEQFSILFKLIGDIPLNTGFTHKENVELKKLVELSEYMLNNEITPIDIIQIGYDNLIEADKVEVIFNKTYISQSKAIKKMNKKMPIHSARELKISVDEIKNLLDGDNSKISIVLNELLLLVVNGIIKNKYSALEEAALLIIDGKEVTSNSQYNYDPYSDQVEDNERILALLKQNRERNAKVGEVIEPSAEDKKEDEQIEHIIDVETVNTEDEGVSQNNELQNSSNTELEFTNSDENSKDFIEEENENSEENFETIQEQKLDETINEIDEQKIIDSFYNDFNELYRIHRKSVFDDLVVSELNEDEIEIQESKIKDDVKKILIEKNQDYKLLNDRGLI